MTMLDKEVWQGSWVAAAAAVTGGGVLVGSSTGKTRKIAAEADLTRSSQSRDHKRSWGSYRAPKEDVHQRRVCCPVADLIMARLFTFYSKPERESAGGKPSAALGSAASHWAQRASADHCRHTEPSLKTVLEELLNET